jgi:hypothetical protein
MTIPPCMNCGCEKREHAHRKCPTKLADTTYQPWYMDELAALHAPDPPLPPPLHMRRPPICWYCQPRMRP